MNAALNIRLRVLASGQNEIKQIEAAMQRLKSMSGASATGGLNASLGAGQIAAGGFFRSIESGFNSLEKFGKNLQWTGRQVEFRFTLPIVAAGLAAGKFALDNERAMTNVKKVYGDLSTPVSKVNRDMTQLKRVFEALSDIFGVQQKDVINIGAAWAQAGFVGTALARATRNTLETMVLGDMDAETATKSLITIQQQYQLSTKQTRLAIAALNVVENQTAADLPELIDGFTRAGATARSAGVDYKHLAALLSVLTPTVGSGAQAGNALKTIFSRLLAPTKAASDMLGQLGIQVDATSWKSKTGAQRIEELAKSYMKLTPAQRAVVSSTIATRFQISKWDQLMRDVTDKQGNYQQSLKNTASDTKNLAILNRELGVVMASQPKSFDILKTKIQNAMARAIVPLLPVILKIADAFVKLVDAFTSLDPQTQQLVFGFLALLAVTGPLFAYLGTTLTLIGRLGAGFAFVGRAVATAAGFFIPFGKNGKEALDLQEKGLTAGMKRNQELGASAKVAATESSSAWSLSYNAQNTAAMEAAAIARRADAEKVASARAAASGATASTAGTATSTVAAGAGDSARAAAAAADAAAVEAIWIASDDAVASAATAAAAETTYAWSAAAQLIEDFATGTGAAWTGAMALTAGEASATAGTMLAAFAPVEPFLMQLFTGLPAGWGTALQLMEGESTKFVPEQLSLFAALDENIVNAMAGLPVGWGTALQLMSGATGDWAAETVTIIESTGQTWVSTLGYVVQANIIAGNEIITVWQAVAAELAAAPQAMSTVWIASQEEILGVAIEASNGVAATWFEATGAIEVYSSTLPVPFGLAMGEMAGEAAAAATAIEAEFTIIPAAAAAAGAESAGAFAAASAFVVPAIAAVSEAAAAAIPIAIGVAIAAAIGLVVAFVVAFKDELGGIWDAIQSVFAPFLPFLSAVFHPIVTLFQNVWYALPAIVQNALVAVIGIVKQAALAVYDWLSYLNPFATHSPSLVSQVEDGVDLIAKKYASLNGIGGTLRTGIDALKEFNQVASMKGLDPTANKIPAARADLAKARPDAVPAFDKLNANLAPLKAALAAVSVEFEKQSRVVSLLNTALDEANAKYKAANDSLAILQRTADKASTALDGAKSTLSDLQNTPIKGMKKADDEIFATTMQTKALQLQIMKLEDAGKSVDSLTNQMAALNGEIEMVNGQKLDLQMNGAGSDVLGPINDRLKGLKDQRSALGAGADQIQNLTDELTALQHKADELDLEKSLKFDPLNKKIQDVTNTVKEMPFDELYAKIKSQQGVVTHLTDVWTTANDAAEKQKGVVDDLGAARDKLQSTYDVEKDKLDKLGDAYDGIEQQISDITDALTNMASEAKSAADAAASAAKSAAGASGGLPSAAGSFKVPGGTGALKDEGGNLKKLADKWLKESKKSFGSLNPFQPIIDKAKNLWHDIEGGLGDAHDAITKWWLKVQHQFGEGASKSGVATAFFDVKDALSSWDNFVKAFNDGITQIDRAAASSGVADFWRGIKDVAITTATIVVGAFQIISKNIGGVFRWLWQEVQQVADILAPEIEKWGALVEPFLNAVGKVFSAITLVVKIALGAILALFWFFWPTIRNVATTMIEVIVRVVRAAMRVLRGVIEVVLGLINGDWDLFAQGIEDIVGGMWDNVVALFTGSVDLVRGIATGLLDRVIQVFQMLRDVAPGPLKGLIDIVIAGFTYLRDTVTNVIDTLSGIIEGVFTAIHGIIEIFLGLVTGDWGRAWNGLKEVVKGVWEIIYSVISGAWTAVWNLLKFGLSVLVGLWNTVWNGVEATARFIWTAIKNTIVGLFNLIVGFIKDRINDIKTVWAFWQSIPGKVSDAFHLVVAAVSKGVGDVITWVKSLPGKILTAVSDAGTWLLHAGEAVWNGFIQGLKNKAGSVGDYIKQKAGEFIHDFTHPWDINSPSKVTQEVGKSAMEGFAKGIKDNVQGAVTAISDAANKLKGAFDVKKIMPKVDAGASKGFSSQLINGFVPPADWGKTTSEKYKQGIVELHDSIISNIDQAIPDVDTAISNLGAGASPQQFITALNGSITAVQTFQKNLSSIIASGNPLLAAQIAKLGPDAGGALAQGFVDQGPGVQASASTMLAFATQATINAKAAIEGEVPAFGLLGASAASNLSTQYGANIQLAALTQGQMSFTAGVISGDTTLSSAAFVKAGEAKFAFQGALALGLVTQQQVGNAQAILAADQALPKGARQLSGNATQQFEQALLLAGVSTDQIALVANAFANDHSADGAAKGLGGRAAANAGQGLSDGLKGAATLIHNAGSSLAGNMDEGFRTRARIFSPSKMMFDNGTALGLGLIQGMNAMAPPVKDAAARIVEGVRGVLAGAGGIFQKAWGSIRGAFSEPINWVIGNVINRFIGGVNDVSGGLGKGAVVHTMGLVPTHHEGGVIGDPTTRKTSLSKKPKSDEQLALMQKGEGVIPKDTMRKISSKQFRMIQKGDLAMVAQAQTDAYVGAKIPPSVAAVANQGGSVPPRGSHESREPQGGWWDGAVHAIADTQTAAVDAALKKIPDVKSMVNGAVSLLNNTIGRFGAGGKIPGGAAQRLANSVQDWLDTGKTDLEKKKASMGGDLAAWRGKPGADAVIIKWLTGKVPFRVSSDFRPGAITVDGNKSLHGFHRAVDLAVPGDFGRDTQGLANIFHAFSSVEGIMAELIYSGPQTSYDIKNGRRVAKYAVDGHHDHVHAALAAGGVAKKVNGGHDVTVGEGRYDEAILPLPQGANKFIEALSGSSTKSDGPTKVEHNYDFRNSKFEFPNVTNGDDAEAFMKGLESLVSD